MKATPSSLSLDCALRPSLREEHRCGADPSPFGLRMTPGVEGRVCLDGTDCEPLWTREVNRDANPVGKETQRRLCPRLLAEPILMFSLCQLLPVLVSQLSLLAD